EGSALANRILAGAGDDRIIGTDGLDVIDGGAGDDTLDFSANTTGVEIDFSSGRYTSIEQIIGSRGGDTISLGLPQSAGLAKLTAAAEESAGAGSDSDDAIRYTNIHESSHPAGELDAASEFVQVSSGGYGVSADGGDGDDTLNGDDYANRLDGGGGNDTLSGGSGSDRLVGGTGADTLNGGEGTDTAEYSLSEEAVTVDLSNGSASGGDAAGDTLTGVENLIGSSRDDSLTGSSDDNLLTGGAGADTLNGGDGIDTADYSTSSEGVSVNLFTDDLSFGDAAGDTLTNIENLVGSSHNDHLVGSSDNTVLTGGDGDDRLFGNDGDDTLHGGAGRDDIGGGAGSDVIIGGEGGDSIATDGGDDVIRYTSTLDAPPIDITRVEKIIDFVHFGSGGGDRIDLSQIDANTATAEDDSFSITTHGVGNHGPGVLTMQFIVHGSGDGPPGSDFGALHIKGYVDDDSNHDFEIVVSRLRELYASDFIL
ncbi:hypothetical protein KXS07_37135, partial [Inquilinus limosus]|uniref:calcium-binding protein n=1 Tax=Inquilinus limosus TaxID=171674 RepID=UPI003F181EB5